MRRRLVAIQADLGEEVEERWQYGSGLLISGGRVLTAAHVVQDATSVSVRRPDDAASLAADMHNALIGDPHRLDLAVLDVPEAELLSPVPVAAINRDVTGGEHVEDCWAIGYPEFAEVERDDSGESLRETAQVRGNIAPLSGLKEHLLYLQVTTVEPWAELPKSGPLDESGGWAGMSGAAVFAGDLLIGVVTEHLPGRGPSNITVTPLDRLLDAKYGPIDPSEWWALLRAPNPARLPRLPYRPEPAYRATLHVIRQRTPRLLDREDVLSRIRGFATANDAVGLGSGPVGYAWLVGEQWAGKTALLAEAVHTLPADVDVVAYFLSIVEADASREQFFAAAIPQLAWLLGAEVPSEVDLHVFRDHWARAASRAESLGRRLLLVVDGLDEDLRPGGPSVAAALPTANLGEHARVLISSRRNADPPDDVTADHPMRSIAQFELSDSPHAVKLGVLAQQELHGLLERDGTANDLGFDVLGLLTAAGGPLSIHDLAKMADVKARYVRAFVNQRAERSLRQVGAQNNPRFTFRHRTLLETCRQDPDVGDSEYRERLHHWADGWRANRWPVSDDAPADTPRYLLDYYPRTLSSEPERLATLVGDIGWLDTAVLRTGIDQVLATLREAARLAPTTSEAAVMLRLLQVQSHHLRATQEPLWPGETATQVAWEALRAGLNNISGTASKWLHGRPAPQLIPIWTTERTSRALIRTIAGHRTRLRAIAVTGQGKVITSSEDGVLRLWDLNVVGDPGREVAHPDHGVTALAATPQGKVVSGGSDGALRLWNPDALDDPGHQLGRHEGWVSAIAATSQGKVVSGGSDGALRLWDPDVLDDPGRELGCHENGLSALVATVQGTVVSAGYDGAVCLWDPSIPNNPSRKVGRHDGWASALAATRHGMVVSAVVLSAGYDGVLWLWDPSIPNDPGRELGRHEDGVTALVATEQGKIVSGGSNGIVRLWDLDCLGKPGEELGRHDGPVVALAITSEDKVVSAGDDGVIRLWDPEVVEASRLESGRQATALVLAATPQGEVVSGGEDGMVRLWDPAGAAEYGRPVGSHVGRVQAVAVTPQGEVISGGDDGLVCMWGPDVTHSVRYLGGHVGMIFTVAVTPDGKVISAGLELAGDASGVVWLWDPTVTGDSGREIGHHPPAVRVVAVTPDGKVISGGVDGALRLWDPTIAGDPGRELGRHDAGVRTMAITAQGKVVSGTDDGVVAIWDPDVVRDSGRELGRHRFSGRAVPVIIGGEVTSAGRPSAGVWAVAITAAGKIISTGSDGIVRLWDPDALGDLGRELGHHDHPVEALTITRDGHVVVATNDGLTCFQLTQS